MNSAANRSEPPAAGFEVVAVALGGLAVAMGVVVVGGALLAVVINGGHLGGGLSDWLQVAGRLAKDPGAPATAWGVTASQVPGPVVYWACTASVAVVVCGLTMGVVALWRRWASPPRKMFGVATDAWIATPRDVRTLAVKSTLPPAGRMLLGRMLPSGPILATEDRERHPMRRRAAKRRQGDRGSVALIGPTRSGKTVLLSGGIVGWDGPVVALSVKRDLYNATASARAGRGELAMFDPGGGTKLPTARWTPLRDVTTASGAARAGRALAAAIPRTGVEGGDFWAQHGETFVVAYMALAGLSRLLPGTDANPREPLTIQRLARWAYLHVGITEPAVHELVETGLSSKDLEIRHLATNAETKLRAFHDEDPKIRDSIYATARLAFESWTEPSVGHSASLDPRPAYNSPKTFGYRPRYVDLEWLMSGGEDRSNTLYLSAPSIEFARLAPVLGGLLGDLRGQLHEWDIEGRRIEKPLLFVIDEAGQLELAWLPEEVSTISGLGGMFVTCWQSKAQISHRYGTLADAVLGGHRSKVFFSGTDDVSTLDYVSRIAGTVHLAQRGWSAETTGGRKTVSEHAQREDLVPAHVIRQMEPQQAVLVHGTLPPVHLQSVLWWQDRQLRKLVPTDAKGRPIAPGDTGTCPLTDEPAGDASPMLDAASVQEAKDHLPAAKVVRTSATAPAPRSWRPDHVSLNEAGVIDDEVGGAEGNAATRSEPLNRSAMICHSCGCWIAVGKGTVAKRGHETLARCAPSCPVPS